MVAHLKSQGALRRPHCCAILSLALAVAFSPALPALATGIDQIANPRPVGWVVDLTARIAPDSIAALNHLGNAIHKQTGAEMAVVVVGSTDGAESQKFATDLFNRPGTRGDGQPAQAQASICGRRGDSSCR
jgi:uncharacterized membrane protein YgcG